jgi:hypothetical protein
LAAASAAFFFALSAFLAASISAKVGFFGFANAGVVARVSEAIKMRAIAEFLRMSQE